MSDETRLAELEARIDRLERDNAFIRDAIMRHTNRYDALIDDLSKRLDTHTHTYDRYQPGYYGSGENAEEETSLPHPPPEPPSPPCWHCQGVGRMVAWRWMGIEGTYVAMNAPCRECHAEEFGLIADEWEFLPRSHDRSYKSGRAGAIIKVSSQFVRSGENQ